MLYKQPGKTSQKWSKMANFSPANSPIDYTLQKGSQHLGKSGKVKEQFFLKGHGFLFFSFSFFMCVSSQGKSGNFALTEVNQVSALIKMHFFIKSDLCRDFFASITVLGILK